MQSFNRPLAVTAAVIRGEGRAVMMARRGDDDAQGGHFEFPGGKIEFGETPERSLQREIAEELGFEVRVDGLLSVETEVYDGAKHILLLTYFCTLAAVDPTFGGRPELIWIDPLEDLSTVPILPPDRRNIERLRDLFTGREAGEFFV